jgi:hypothetical protein
MIFSKPSAFSGQLYELSAVSGLVFANEAARYA